MERNSMENNARELPTEGKKLLALLSTADFKTLRLRPENLEKLKSIQALFIVGASGVGKTTIRNILEGVAKEGFDFPTRIITRAQRPNDDLHENQFATDLDDLKRRVEGGLIWKRDLGENTEYYGFMKPKQNHFPIYSANNAFVRERDSLIQEPTNSPVDSSLIMLVHAPDDERNARRQERDGNYFDTRPAEHEIRSSQRAISTYPEAHVLVKNFNEQDKEALKEDLRKLMEIIALMKK